MRNISNENDIYANIFTSVFLPHPQSMCMKLMIWIFNRLAIQLKSSLKQIRSREILGKCVWFRFHTKSGGGDRVE